MNSPAKWIDINNFNFNKDDLEGGIVVMQYNILLKRNSLKDFYPYVILII